MFLCVWGILGRRGLELFNEVVGGGENVESGVRVT
jgi:hypothetical protein